MASASRLPSTAEKEEEQEDKQTEKKKMCAVSSSFAYVMCALYALRDACRPKGSAANASQGMRGGRGGGGGLLGAGSLTCCTGAASCLGFVRLAGCTLRPMGLRGGCTALSPDTTLWKAGFLSCATSSGIASSTCCRNTTCQHKFLQYDYLACKRHNTLYRLCSKLA